ncbi:indole-3-acetate O-methyltransferase 1-like [Mizuhopecten yessoensis]|uniref:indole-3-acetate O-methyltransferase 1-like n=1 Tax=Mizuhopecten yessoensis TaxID=6573 RepID=UPI000B45B554|nr:indole-3-acetate O-methyltransferase 1-like [Mizuhopecten yessoensis]
MTSNPELQGVVYNGADSYSSGMENSRKVVRTAIKQLLQCVENLLKPGNGNSRTICIAEFGAADGGVSLELMDTVIDNINQMSSDPREITLVYEDQLFNDFNVLFQTVHATNSEICNKLSVRDNVHVLASATSMYRKCLPTASVDLAFSSMANHWLSEKPCDIRGGIFQSDCDRNELEAFRHQWQTDWKQFLSCRAKELQPGGYLVVVSFVTDDVGRCNNHVGEDSYDVFSSIWKGFRQSGKISEEEFIYTSSVTYHPSKTELVQPFQADIEGSLSLVSCTQRDVEILPGLATETGIEDKETFVDRSLNCIKPWMYNILMSGLSPDRTEADKGRLLDEYFKTLRNILMQRTTFCPILYRTACVIAKRT